MPEFSDPTAPGGNRPTATATTRTTPTSRFLAGLENRYKAVEVELAKFKDSTENLSDAQKSYNATLKSLTRYMSRFEKGVRDATGSLFTPTIGADWKRKVENLKSIGKFVEELSSTQKRLETSLVRMGTAKKGGDAFVKAFKEIDSGLQQGVKLLNSQTRGLSKDISHSLVEVLKRANRQLMIEQPWIPKFRMKKGTGPTAIPSDFTSSRVSNYPNYLPARSGQNFKLGEPVIDTNKFLLLGKPYTPQVSGPGTSKSYEGAPNYPVPANITGPPRLGRPGPVGFPMPPNFPPSTTVRQGGVGPYTGQNVFGRMLPPPPPPPSGGGGGAGGGYPWAGILGGLLGNAARGTIAGLTVRNARRAIDFVHRNYTGGEQDMMNVFNASRFVAAGAGGVPGEGSFGDVAGNVYGSLVPFRKNIGPMRRGPSDIQMKAGNKDFHDYMRDLGIGPNDRMAFMQSYQLPPSRGLWSGMKTAAAASRSAELGFLDMGSYGEQMSRMAGYGYGTNEKEQESQRQQFASAIALGVNKGMPKEQVWNTLTKSLDYLAKTNVVLSSSGSITSRVMGMMTSTNMPTMRTGVGIEQGFQAIQSARAGIIGNPYLFGMLMQAHGKGPVNTGSIAAMLNRGEKGAGTEWQKNLDPRIAAMLNDKKMPAQQKIAMMEKFNLLPEMAEMNAVRQVLARTGMPKGTQALVMSSIFPGAESMSLEELMSGGKGAKGPAVKSADKIREDLSGSIIHNLLTRSVDAEEAAMNLQKQLVGMMSGIEAGIAHLAKGGVDDLDAIVNWINSLPWWLAPVHSGGTGGAAAGGGPSGGTASSSKGGGTGGASAGSAGTGAADPGSGPDPAGLGTSAPFKM